MNEQQKILNVKFYSLDYLSLLLLDEGNKTSSLIQLSMNQSALKDASISLNPIINLGELVENNCCKSFQDIFPRTIAVSGQRKVVSILNENKRKVRILQVEVNEENASQAKPGCNEENMMDITPIHENSEENISHFEPPK